MLHIDPDHTTAVGNDVLSGDGVALALMSNRNSYFTAEHIGEIVAASRKRGMHLILVAPDEPEEANYRAFGKTPLEAMQKSRSAFNQILNKASRFIQRESPAPEILRWETIRKQDAYQKMYRWLNALYAENTEFQAAVRVTTYDVLRSKEKHGAGKMDHPERQMNVAVEFLLKEYAFLLAAGTMFGDRKTSSLYHRPMPVYERLINGEFGTVPIPNAVGIITASVQPERDSY